MFVDDVGFVMENTAKYKYFCVSAPDSIILSKKKKKSNNKLHCDLIIIKRVHNHIHASLICFLN